MPLPSSATQAIAAGLATATVTGTFAAAYQVLLAPAWNTSYLVSNKVIGSFDVTFAVPAPAGGSSFDWLATLGVVGPGAAGAATLTSYLAELRRLLHDPNDVYWSVADKTANLNTAIRQRDRDTGGQRVNISKTLTIGTDTYNFSTLSNVQVYDVINIWVQYAGGRVRLNPLAYSALTERYRPWINYQGIPEAWARYGPSDVIFGPIPSLAYVTEWDCCVYSSPLVNLTDGDPLPYPYTDPVPFYAAFLCKTNERQMEEAAEFLSIYRLRLTNIEGARVGMIPTVGR